MNVLPAHLSALTLHQLRVFATAAREGSFAKAAELLMLSEPAVSMQIKALERLVGQKLFERTPGRRRVELTEAGRTLLRTCDEVFEAIDRGAKALQALQHEQRTRITIGVGPHFGGYVLPRIYGQFRRDRPDILVCVKVIQRAREILDGVIHDNLDLGVIGGPIHDPRLCSEPLLSFDNVLVGPPGHRLAHGPPVPFSALASEQFILRDESAMARKVLERMAVEHGITLNIALELTDVDTQIQAILSGLGIALMVKQTVAHRIASGQLSLLQVQGFPIRLNWYIIHKTSLLSSAVQVFKTFLLDHCAELEQKRSI